MRILEWLRGYMPRTLRGKLFALSLVAVAVPITTVGYVLQREGQQTLLSEKEAKLFGLTRVLDARLGSGFEALLNDYHGAPDDRQAMVRYLNTKLARFTDLVAAANPGVGVGYYDRALHAIITYGPSGQYGDTVGIDIPPGHPGWKVLETGKPAVASGRQVRGLILNAMLPIVRNGSVVGYIWADELSEEVHRQEMVIVRAVTAITFAGVLLGLGIAQMMSQHLSREVRDVIHGLACLRTDLHHTIVPSSDEIGEIASEVNFMARSLLDARTLTENILNSIADGVIAIDRESRISSLNPAAENMMGTKASEVIGRPYRSLFDQAVPFPSALLDTLEGGHNHIGVEASIPLPHQTLHVSVSTSILRDSHGREIGAVVVLKDLTERHQLRTQIMRADRLAALGELMAGIAHEIRNPLTSIRGFVQFLETSDDTAEWRRYAPILIRQVDSLNRIITELLEFGRQRPPSIRPVEIAELVREVVLLAGRQAGIEVQLALQLDCPAIEADPEAVKQALLNLLINAMQSIEVSGMIRIGTVTEADGRTVAITVSDNGIGIAPENLEKVFDPFFSTKPNGTGLGLAMVHRIVDAHDGTISVSSTPGEGTVVILRLPVRHKVKEPA